MIATLGCAYAGTVRPLSQLARLGAYSLLPRGSEMLRAEWAGFSGLMRNSEPETRRHWDLCGHSPGRRGRVRANVRRAHCVQGQARLSGLATGLACQKSNIRLRFARCGVSSRCLKQWHKSTHARARAYLTKPNIQTVPQLRTRTCPVSADLGAIPFMWSGNLSRLSAHGLRRLLLKVDILRAIFAARAA